MIKFSFLLISILSLFYGLIFLITPFWFVNLTDAELVNIAWLRNIGAAVLGVLFYGCLQIYYKPHGKLVILKIITLTSFLQTGGLIYSRFYNEFSATNIFVIDLTIFIAIFTCVYFLYILVNKRHLFR